MPRPALNLAGQRFGSLVASHRDLAAPEAVFWVCKCDCGHEKSVRSSNLQSGRSTTCGWYDHKARTRLLAEGTKAAFEKRTEMAVGKKYGSLTALEVLPDTHDGRPQRILFRCDCGKEDSFELGPVQAGKQHCRAPGCNAGLRGYVGLPRPIQVRVSVQEAPEMLDEWLNSPPSPGEAESLRLTMCAIDGTDVNEAFLSGC